MKNNDTAGEALDLNKLAAIADRVEARGLFNAACDIRDWIQEVHAALARAGSAAPTGQQAETIANIHAARIKRLEEQQNAHRPDFLLNGTRFKLNFSTRGNVDVFHNYAAELQGRWVALVPAEDDCHLAAPTAAQKEGASEQDAWISVEERLPEPMEGRMFSEEVLVVHMNSNWPAPRVSRLHFEEDGPTVWSGGDPTHWKLLPALPAMSAAQAQPKDTTKGQA